MINTCITNNTVSLAALFAEKARYYDSGIGRFLEVDPDAGALQRPHSLNNRYSYVSNNSTNNTDPSGKIALSNVFQNIKAETQNFARTPVGRMLLTATAIYGASAIAAPLGAAALAGAATGVTCALAYGLYKKSKGEDYDIQEAMARGALVGAFAGVGGAIGAVAGPAGFVVGVTAGVYVGMSFNNRIDGMSTKESFKPNWQALGIAAASAGVFSYYNTSSTSSSSSGDEGGSSSGGGSGGYRDNY